jgi:hypothetical protein
LLQAITAAFPLTLSIVRGLVLLHWRADLLLLLLLLGVTTNGCTLLHHAMLGMEAKAAEGRGWRACVLPIADM